MAASISELAGAIKLVHGRVDVVERGPSLGDVRRTFVTNLGGGAQKTRIIFHGNGFVVGKGRILLYAMLTDWAYASM